MSHLVIYDGVCGLCDRFVQFLIRIDRGDQLRFTALQSELGTHLLRDAGRDTSALETVIVMADYGTPSQRLLERSDAAIFAIASAGGLYGAAVGLRVFPRFLRDAVYRIVARSRYRIFGRFDACQVPSPATRRKFLDFKTGDVPR